jgi:hypothetical protein
MDYDPNVPRHLDVITAADACSLLLEEWADRCEEHPGASLLLASDEIANPDWFRVKFLYLEKTDQCVRARVLLAHDQSSCLSRIVPCCLPLVLSLWPYSWLVVVSPLTNMFVCCRMSRAVACCRVLSRAVACCRDCSLRRVLLFAAVVSCRHRVLSLSRYVGRGRTAFRPSSCRRVFKFCRSELTELYNKLSGCNASNESIFGPNMSVDEFMGCWLVGEGGAAGQELSASAAASAAAPPAAGKSAPSGKRGVAVAEPPPVPVIEQGHLRADYLLAKAMSLTCYRTDRNENVTFVDFLEAIARMAKRLYPPAQIDRTFDVSVARFMAVHLAANTGVSKRARRYLEGYEVPKGERVLTNVDLLED